MIGGASGRIHSNRKKYASRRTRCNLVVAPLGKHDFGTGRIGRMRRRRQSERPKGCVTLTLSQLQALVGFQHILKYLLGGRRFPGVPQEGPSWRAAHLAMCGTGSALNQGSLVNLGIDKFRAKLTDVGENSTCFGQLRPSLLEFRP